MCAFTDMNVWQLWGHCHPSGNHAWKYPSQFHYAISLHLLICWCFKINGQERKRERVKIERATEQDLKRVVWTNLFYKLINEKSSTFLMIIKCFKLLSSDLITRPAIILFFKFIFIKLNPPSSWQKSKTLDSKRNRKSII